MNDEWTSLGLRSFPYDDAVTLGIKSLVKHLLISFILWIISLIFIMIHWIWPLVMPWTIYSFIPMWIGSIYGFISIILILKSICFSSKLITRQEREYLLSEHEEVNGNRLIDYDSLLLLRYFSFYGVVLCLSILLIFISQVLIAWSLATAEIGLWSALCPIIILSIIIIICLYLIKSVNLTTSILLTLCFVEAILLIAKMKSQIALPWFLVLLPGLLVQASLLLQVSYIFYLHFRRRCTLSILQQSIIFSHMISLLFPFIPEYLTFRAEFVESYSTELLFDPSTWHQLKIWYCVISLLFLLTIMGVFYLEASFIAQTRGFTSPLPISKTSRGWIPLTSRRIFIPLVGTISILNYSIDGGDPLILRYWLDPCIIFCELNICWHTCMQSSQSNEFARSPHYSGYGSIDRGGIQSPIPPSNRLSTSSRSSLRQSIETYELLPRKKSGDLDDDDDDFEMI